VFKRAKQVPICFFIAKLGVAGAKLFGGGAKKYTNSNDLVEQILSAKFSKKLHPAVHPEFLIFRPAKNL
jgi:hypothetical protein